MHLSALRLVFRLSWQVSRVQTAGVAALTVAQQFAGVVTSVGLGWTVNAVTRQDSASLLLGVLTTAAGQAVGVVGWPMLTVHRVMLNQKVGELIDRDVLRRVAELPDTAHLDEPDQVQRIEAARRSGQHMANAVWSSVTMGLVAVQLAVSTVLLAMVEAPFALLALAVLPTLWCSLLSRRTVARAGRAAAPCERVERSLFEAATDPERAMDLWLRGGMRFAMDRAEHHRRAATATRLRAEARAAVVDSLGWAAFLAGYVAALVFLCRQVTEGRVSVGSLLLVATLTMAMRRSVTLVAGGMSGAVSGWESLSAYLWLRGRGGTRTTTAALPPDRLVDGIRLRGVRFRYPAASRDAVAAIDLHLPADTTVALVGGHGSGKSTLVKLVCGLLEPSAGEVAVEGVALTALTAASWWQRVTAAFQDYCRFSFTARESIGVADLARVDDDSAFTRPARVSGASEVLAQLPDGLDTLLGTDLGSGVELSGGQWQRIALARALFPDRPLLTVLDEPTAALDAASEYELYRAFEEAARSRPDGHGGIVLLVSHRLSTVRMADLIVFVEEGRIVEQGDHRTLMEAGGRYAELYALQEAAFS